jgi:hypothetical protein
MHGRCPAPRPELTVTSPRSNELGVARVVQALPLCRKIAKDVARGYQVNLRGAAGIRQ